jgi:hypothetical protein
MCWRELFLRGKNIFGDRVENARIFPKEANVENFLGIRESEV